MRSENVQAAFDWLKTKGFMKTMFTLDEKTEISHAFDAGNYASAYETTDLEYALEHVELKDHERAAFVLGFFGSYALHEISDREIFDECYFSDAGRYVVREARYCDSRDEEYAEESDATPSLPQTGATEPSEEGL